MFSKDLMGILSIHLQMYSKICIFSYFKGSKALSFPETSHKSVNMVSKTTYNNITVFFYYIIFHSFINFWICYEDLCGNIGKGLSMSS